MEFRETLIMSLTLSTTMSMTLGLASLMTLVVSKLAAVPLVMDRPRSFWKNLASLTSGFTIILSEIVGHISVVETGSTVMLLPAKLCLRTIFYMDQGMLDLFTIVGWKMSPRITMFTELYRPQMV